MTPARSEPTDRDHAAWVRLRAELRRAVDGVSFDIWLAPLALHAVEPGRVVLLAPDPRKRRWVAERFGRVLRGAAAATLGPGTTVEVLCDEDLGRETAREPGLPAPAHRPEPAPLNPKLTFDQFVIGATNHLAHAAALAVAELPGTAYNPLFIYGPPGVGKTHLLQSIANYLREYAPGLTSRYTTAERFTNEFQAALAAKDTEAFKDAYRSNDVLLIDDVQFLERKARTEEEFFHTFNALHEGGAQLVLTSDRTPRDLRALEDRLRERFEAGLVTDIRAPDLATRLAVLRKRAAVDHLTEVREDVLEAIAGHVDDNVRQLEGALIGVVAHASLTGRELDVAIVDERLGGGGGTPTDGRGPGGARRSAGPPTIGEVQAAVAERFAVTREDLLSATRAGRVAWPRQVAMALTRELTPASLPTIGAAFGGRNHTTVLHAVRRCRQRTAEDAEARQTVRELAVLLGADRSG